jgi:hypothetical protein
MLSTQDWDVTSRDKETAKENIEHLEIQRESARRLSAFAEPD